MPEYVPLTGYQQLQDALKVHGNDKCLIYMYFFGEKDPKTGKSWCPDCVAGKCACCSPSFSILLYHCLSLYPYAVETVVETAFREQAHPNSLIYTVDVGNRETWKDKSNRNLFRQAPFSLTQIPALQRWQSSERLDGSQLSKPDLLQMFFEEGKTQSNIDTTKPCK